MTNRQRYITQSNELDLMLRIRMSYACICPIRAIIGEYPAVNVCKALPEDCPECIQKWLNREEEIDNAKKKSH